MGLQERFDGFAVEVGAGGCLLLSRYIDGGGFVWITCREGGGLPDLNDWLVVAYGADIDEEIFSSAGDGPQGLFEAIGEAVAAAKAFIAPDELCLLELLADIVRRNDSIAFYLKKMFY